MQLHHHITIDDAIKLKSRGGVAIQALTDFAIQDDRTYSFKRIAQFSRTRINRVNALRKDLGLTTKSPGKVISDYVMRLILDEETHKQLVVVFHGNVDFNFAHAACFVRTRNYRGMKQMLLLDCKNKTPIVCPRLGADQMEFEESLIIKDDIEASYYKWEIYALERRVVQDETERRKIHNRMKYVLTGDRQYQKESQSFGARMTLQKREQRKYRKRKGRRFDLRKDHTLNEKKKRRASTQKANAIMQNEEEQPLMAEKSIKSQNDAPMEEVEVNHEDANTAIMQEDD